LAITTHSTTTRAPTRKATIVQAMASRLTGLLLVVRRVRNAPA